MHTPRKPAHLTRRALILGALGTACAVAVDGRSRKTVPAAAFPPAPVVPPPPGPEHYTGMVPTQFGMDLPGITRTVPTSPGVRTLALTFDACGGPHGSAVDWKLINVLRRHRVPATLFFNSRWVEANPTPRAELSNDPLFQIESHGATHAPMSVTGRSAYGIPGTSSPSEVIAEIAGASRWFRAGTAHYDDVAVRIIRDRGIRIAGFTTNLDYGGTASPDAVTTNLLGAPDGAIILGHMNQPRGGTAIGVDAALNRLANVQFVKLPLVTSA